ncbi:MAG: lysophospholipid acyltransferase family protein [Elusimicrobia bacterium]|nr:lysophospholipid acyltransferase family protein [Elusimicrobiota bacterium]
MDSPELGFKMAVVARRVKNPYVNDMVTRFRSCSGTQVILARNAVRETIRWLKAGNVTTMLIDHRVMEGGLRVPFFGRPAYTSSLPAVLALRYSIPVHCARCWKDGDTIRLQFERKMDFSGLEQSQEGVAEATQRMNRVIEGWIRERPELWLWIHNRWKGAD